MFLSAQGYDAFNFHSFILYILSLTYCILDLHMEYSEAFIMDKFVLEEMIYI